MSTLVPIAIESGSPLSSLLTPRVVEEKNNEKGSSIDVDWADENDQLNPANWRASKKWRNLLIIAAMAFITYVNRTSPKMHVAVDD